MSTREKFSDTYKDIGAKVPSISTYLISTSENFEINAGLAGTIGKCLQPFDIYHYAISCLNEGFFSIYIS